MLFRLPPKDSRAQIPKRPRLYTYVLGFLPHRPNVARSHTAHVRHFVYSVSIFHGRACIFGENTWLMTFVDRRRTALLGTVLRRGCLHILQHGMPYTHGYMGQEQLCSVQTIGHVKGETPFDCHKRYRALCMLRIVDLLKGGESAR